MIVPCFSRVGGREPKNFSCFTTFPPSWECRDIQLAGWCGDRGCGIGTNVVFNFSLFKLKSKPSNNAPNSLSVQAQGDCGDFRVNEWKNLFFHFLSTGSNCSNKLGLHTRIHFNSQHKHHVRFDSYCFFLYTSPNPPPPPLSVPSPTSFTYVLPLPTNCQFPLFFSKLILSALT
jgi:hypothetical protein